MGKSLPIITAGWFAMLFSTRSTDAATNYFLVAEPPGRILHNDSYVIALTNDQQIAHARDLIARGPAVAGAAIVVANVAAGEDTINRDLRRDGVPWCWHVTSVVSFADYTIEILDGWPSEAGTNYPCTNPGTPTGIGQIGFWSYTVVAELPLAPRITLSQSQPAQFSLAVSNLTPPNPVTIEFTTNFLSGIWQKATNLVPDRMRTTILLPYQQRPVLFRARVP